LVRNGKLQRDVVEIILNNVRVPGDMRGDLEAQVSSNRTAVERYSELCGTFGRDIVDAAIVEICDQSERRMRDVIASWPDGDYTAEDQMDNDGITATPVTIRVTIRVRGDELEVDFEGTDPQALGPINSVPGMTYSATYLTLQAATDPEIPANDGCYRPIVVRLPAGSLVSPRFPAPCTGGNETSHRIVNTVMRALADMPYGPRVMACDHGSSNNLFLAARNQNDELSVLYSYPEGGWGALADKDGESALFSIVGNCPNTPAEALELRYPLRLVRYELRPDSGGAGHHRGGLGTRRDYEILSDTAQLSFIADRCVVPPYGLEGGRPGMGGRYLVDRGEGFQDADATFISKGAAIDLKRGDVVSQRTAGGGGFGDPADRRREDLARDLAAGYVSRKQASEAYGIADVESLGATATAKRGAEV